MSELHPKAETKIAKQLVIFKFNSWVFYDIGFLELKSTKTGGKYCILPFPAFGVVDQFETDPANIMMMGKTGDYLFIDSRGELTIIDKSIGHYYV